MHATRDKVSLRLAARFRKSAKARSAVLQEVPTMRYLLDDGRNPLHAAYIRSQHLASIFSEKVSRLKALKEYDSIVAMAEDLYLPGGPPMSPLTWSYFTLWSFFDVCFGPYRETIGTCLLDLADVLELDEPLVEATRNLQQSRMGIFEHVGRTGSKVQLRELVTGKQFLCHSTSGYQGKKGELWYARLCPPIADVAKYHVVPTTPYVLINITQRQWTGYLNKNIAGADNDVEKALDRFLKFGKTRFQWHEFVLEGYHHAQFDAIFLAGIPDVKASLPHAD